MKVLQINAVYGRLSTGTIMRNIQLCSREHGIEAYVAFPKLWGVPDDFSYEIGSFFDHKLHAVLSRITGRQAYFSLYATKGLLRYMNLIKPDIVHLHNLHSNYIHLNVLLQYLAQKNITTVITMHDCWYFTGGCFHYANVGCEKWQTGCGNCPKMKIDDTAKVWKDRAQYLNAIPHLTMVGCSEWIANECRRSFLKDKDIRTIYNGFDLNIFKHTESDWRRRLNIEDKFVLIGPASKWLSEVNKPTYDFFVSNMLGNMVLVLFGCKEIDKSTPVNVKQIGFVKNPKEMAQVYSMADVLVNCSREDTLSSLNLEAQACGTPVVTYEATGSKETVDGISGFAVETGNYKALLEQTMKINETGKTKLSQSCRKWASDKFEMNSSYNNYVNLYQELISK